MGSVAGSGFGPKAFVSSVREEAAQLLLHQGFFLRLGGLCHQQEQCHAGERQSADQNGVMLYKH